MMFFSFTHHVYIIGVSFVEKKQLPWTIENISQWLWKDFFRNKKSVFCSSGTKTLVVNRWGGPCICIFGTHFCDKHQNGPIKLCFKRKRLKKEKKRKTQPITDKSTPKRPWKDEAQFINLLLTLHFRSFLRFDFLQHALSKSSFYISLSTVTACGVFSKQFVTCVNYYPRAGWVAVWSRGCYSKECLHSMSPLLVGTASSQAGPRCLTLECSLYPSISSSSSFTTSPPTYGSTFASTFHCVCNSFLALSSLPHLSETSPFKATASPLRLISGSPCEDRGESIMQTAPTWHRAVTSLIPLLPFSLSAVICILMHKCSQKYLDHVSFLFV